MLQRANKLLRLGIRRAGAHRFISIGIPTEVKKDEFRVGITPSGVHLLVSAGHDVTIQSGAGLGSAIADEAFESQGAHIVKTAEEVWQQEMIVKVKEPLPEEYPRIDSQLIFTYFHLAGNRELTMALLGTKATCVAYETVEVNQMLPLLLPMSEVAGRMAVQQGAKYLERPMGGCGKLLAGVPGVAPGHVLIIGGGVVGKNAAFIASGMGAVVTVLDNNVNRLRCLNDIFKSSVHTVFSTPYSIKKCLTEADVVIGAVLNSGETAPKLIQKDTLASFKPQAVLVDVSIDQGGVADSSRPTTHTNPTYVVDGVSHYCVANIPGAVPATSTWALTNVTLPYVLELANKGWKAAAQSNPALSLGVNTIGDTIVHAGVAKSFPDLNYREISKFL